jgi:glycosyltransferase involved in cell wall biosynthesis
VTHGSTVQRRLVFWGTYDVGKPRVRLLLAGARKAGFDVLECHAHVWEGIEDKSQLTGISRKVRALARWLLAYPSLMYRYLRLPDHDAVVVGYPGALDVLILWPLARWRRTPILWDVFLSLYDTIVNDRKLVGRWSPVAWGLYVLEWLAARAATQPFLDSQAHADYFASLFHLTLGSVPAVPVGAEDVFERGPITEAVATADTERAGTWTVLFYGQFIPLHGLDVVIDAAALLARETDAVRWVIIGQGQEAGRIDARLAMLNTPTVSRVDWVPYQELPQWISRADVCLGIFGTTQKARNVIPNKVYQVLASGRLIVTSDTPAQRELLVYGAEPWLTFVPPGDAQALAAAILHLYRHGARPPGTAVIVGADEVGGRLGDIVRATAGSGE